MIRGRDPRAELLVNCVECVECQGLRFAKGEQDHVLDDPLDSSGITSHLVVVCIRLEDLQHPFEVIFANQDFSLGVHVADPAIGRHDLDLLSAAGCAAKGADYVVGLVGHLGYYGVSPIIRFSHVGSHRIVSE